MLRLFNSDAKIDIQIRHLTEQEGLSKIDKILSEETRSRYNGCTSKLKKALGYSLMFLIAYPEIEFMGSDSASITKFLGTCLFVCAEAFLFLKIGEIEHSRTMSSKINPARAKAIEAILQQIYPTMSTWPEITYFEMMAFVKQKLSQSQEDKDYQQVCLIKPLLSL